jgi:uncharacterized Zn finger protein
MDEKMPSLECVSPSALRTLAGSKAFQLGKEYFDEGAVRNLCVVAGSVRALVNGTASYRVVLRVEEGELLSDCSCPRAGDGYFCKHCVAVGLAWLASNGELAIQTSPAAKEKRRDPWDDIRNYLRRQETDVLIALLLDMARRDDRLYRSLLLKAERGADGADLAGIFRKTIDDATRSNGYVAWDEVGELLNTLDEVLGSLAELLQPATSGILVELLEYAIERVEAMLEEVDDSDGGVGEIVARLGDLHIEACHMAMPDPAALAERLLQMELTSPFGICSFDPSVYREVLGEPGLHRYRELALAEWRTVEARKADDPYEAGRMAITRIMEGLAKERGDIEQLVEIKSRDLSSGFRYLQIAELWHKAGKMELALEWAERGLAAFPDRTDHRLREFLVEIYLHCGRNDDAVALSWMQFEEQPVLENYKQLAMVAGKAGQWHTRRERALSVVDAVIAARNAGYRPWGSQPRAPDYSLRIAVALWEQDVGTAWQYANLGACDRNLLIALADKLEAVRLDDAIELYRRVVPALLEQTNNHAYEQAVGLVQRMADALGAHHRGPELEAYVNYLRVEFKRKRNFMKLLERFTFA